jgi:ABC-type sugar transport system substrate-binding protein
MGFNPALVGVRGTPYDVTGMRQRSIALFLINQSNDYQDLQRSDCLAAARRHALLVDVHSADNDSEKQVRQIREVVNRARAERPVAILVAPVRESVLLGVAQDAVRQGISWVALNRSSDYLQELRRDASAPPSFCVTPDQRQIGRIQGRQFRILLPEGGELLYVCGPLGTYSTQRRMEGAQKELDGTKINMVAFNSDWSTQGGADVARSWINIFRNRTLPATVIGAQNDEMAMGARTALLEEASLQRWPELRRVRVTGCDGSLAQGQRAVTDGHLAATVIVPPTAGRAIEELGAFLAGGALPLVEVVLPVTPYPELGALTKSMLPPRPEGRGH